MTDDADTRPSEDAAADEDAPLAATGLNDGRRRALLERLNALRQAADTGDRPPGTAFGQWLGDFLDQETASGLLPAEEKLLVDVASARDCVVNEVLPEDDADRLAVRGGFLGFLALGGDEAAPVSRAGIAFKGAVILSELNLSAASGVVPLHLHHCRFETAPQFNGASCASLRFPGCSMPGFQGEDLRVANGLGFNNQFVANGGVQIPGARIEGTLNCSAGSFVNRLEDGRGWALDLDDADIGGSVYLNGDFRAEGGVRLLGARIGRDLNCRGGRIANAVASGGAMALRAERAKITGVTHLNRGFIAEGEVNFANATIGSNFNCTGGTFINAAPSRSGPDLRICQPALNLRGAQINGSLILWEPTDDERPTRLHGSLTLAGAHVRRFLDHPDAWPGSADEERPDAERDEWVVAAGGQRLRCEIRLDGFTYDQLSGDGRYDAATRKRWLARQPHRHQAEDFRPQPYEQLASVMRTMGHERDARSIAKARQWRQQWARMAAARQSWQAQPGLETAAALVWSWISGLVLLFLLGVLAGYGYGKKRLIVMLIAVWLTGAWIYGQAAEQGLMAPSHPVIFANPTLAAACHTRWTTCKSLPKEHTAFEPLLYSADVLLPIIALGVERDWAPIFAAGPAPGLPRGSVLTLHLIGQKVTVPPWFLRFIYWLQILVGWVLSALLVAVLSGVMKRE